MLHDKNLQKSPNTNLLSYFNNIKKEQLAYSKLGCDNLSPAERHIIDSLSKNRSIIFKPADKGGSLVILNASDYISKAKTQLANTTHYQKIPSNPTLHNANEIPSLIQYLFCKGSIPKEFAKFLESKYPPRTPIFYGLPKIHKTNIVSACDSPTENLSNILDYLAQPFMKSLPSYIKNSKDFIKTVLELPPYLRILF